MDKITRGRQSAQFSLNDERVETCPRFNAKVQRVEGAVTYFMMQTLEALRLDLGEYDLTTDDQVMIQLNTIDDGKGVIHMVVGRLTIDKKAIVV